MAKRKRGSNEESPVDFGLGATLAHLQNNEDAEHGTLHAGAKDDEGWTVVGPNKKKKRRDSESNSHRQFQSNDRRDSRHHSNSHRHRDRRADSSDEMSEDEKPGREPTSKPIAPVVGAAHAFDNPFTPKGDTDSRQQPSNPFSARDKEAEANEEADKDKTTADGVSKTSRQSEREARRKERKLERNYPAIEHSPQARIQNFVKITDLQALALYILADGTAPQWVSVRNRTSIRQVVVLMVPGLELDMFSGKVPIESVLASGTGDKDDKPKRLSVDPDDYYPIRLRAHKLPAALQPLSEIFPDVWPILAQGESRGHNWLRLHSPISTMLTSQIPRSKEEKQFKKSRDHKGPLPQGTKHWENKRTPITEYLASLVEQRENEYVIHPAWFSSPEAKESAYANRKAGHQTAEDGWVDTNVEFLDDGKVPEGEIESGSVAAGRRVLAVDCEMCKAENDEFVLTRISILDWDGSVVMDKLVKPDVTIKDYLTQYSGITQAMLQDVTTTISDIQKELLEIITPRTILVGHSLNSDLNAMKLTHPFLIDTGILFPHVKGPPFKQSLKWLAQKYLQKAIQKGSNGHDSVDDARTALDLVKQKCERGPGWGTNETNAESVFKRIGRTTRTKSNSTRTGAVVDWGEPTRGHGSHAQVAIGCKSDDEITQAIERALAGQAQGKDGTSEHVDFVWGRLRELELARGWWDDGRTSEDVEAIRQAALKRLGLGSDSNEEVEVTGEELGTAVSRTVKHIVQIYDSLPRCTAFVVYSGTGDPREMRRLQTMQQTYRREYATKNWDKLSVKWTDTEVQALSDACKQGRKGVGFIVVK
ncbi:hypothetical protein P280DRAFT_474258 [Massarina eburnea CBS 473.64]|uniref:Exonuclease domain-containing protein n=1 Tax=Massarina eburnea CBS 473.64 TaxID=1395130 RepID=A0A6A6RIK7_9PLEO|nr:hypothetical protein P280DRAFT_474258 [Massarina eburnea CBS 473.64]